MSQLKKQIRISMKLLKDKKKSNLIDRSSRAICGINEREIVVRVENVEETKRRLKAKGFFVVGTSEVGGRTRKIWFTPSVGL